MIYCIQYLLINTVKPPIVLDTLNIASLQNIVDTFGGSTECEEKSLDNDNLFYSILINKL